MFIEIYIEIYHRDSRSFKRSHDTPFLHPPEDYVTLPLSAPAFVELGRVCLVSQLPRHLEQSCFCL